MAEQTGANFPHGTPSGYTRKCRCAACVEARRAYMRNYYAARPPNNSEALQRKREKRIAAGLCPDCGGERGDGIGLYCKPCIKRKNKLGGAK